MSRIKSSPARTLIPLAVLMLLGVFTSATWAQVDKRMFEGDDPVRVAGEERWDAKHEAWLDKRKSRTERDRRLGSRTRHKDLSAGEAVGLAQRSFPSMLDGDLGPVTDLDRGLKVANRIDDYTARLETSTGEPGGMLVSSRPISVMREDGRRVGVDLDLLAHDDGFKVQTGAADVLLPGRADRAVQWANSGVALRLGGARASDAVLRDDRLFFHDGAGTDADYVLIPAEKGVQVNWHLRSDAAPEAYRMAFDLPAGARLEAVRAAGSMQFVGARVVNEAGEVLQTITAPVSVDADGTAVPTTATVDGDEMIVTVRHKGEDLRYPVLVDPVVQETWTVGGGFASCGANATGGSWSYTHNSAHTAYNFSCWGAGGHGLYVAQANGGYYNQGSTGYWYWNARPDSYIQSVSWSGSRHVTAYNSYGLTNYSLFYAGIWHAACGCWRAYDQWGHSAHWSWTQNANQNSDNTRAVLGIITNGGTGNYYEGGVSGLDGASIIVNDNYAPHNVYLESFEPGLLSSSIGSSYRESRWHNMSYAPPKMSVHAEDRGLGLQKITLNDTLNRWVLWTGLNSTCSGLKNWNCAPNVSTSQSTATTMWQLPEGITAARPAAADVTGKISYGTPINLKNDRSAPVITLSGALWDNRTQVLTGDYNLHVRATDGSAGAANERSGVWKLTVLVDGVQVHEVSQGCVNSCPMDTDHNVTFASLGYVDGTHEVTVKATDQLGHVATTSFRPYWSRSDSHTRVIEASAPSETDLGDAATETDTCASDGTPYCGGLDGSNSETQELMNEEPLVDAPADSTGEPLATAASAGATKVGASNWGISDESSDGATDPAHNDLGITEFRKIVPWDIATNNQFAEPCHTNDFTRFKGDMQRWYDAFQGKELIVAFRHNSCRLLADERNMDPATTFLSAVNEFRKAYPKVKRFSAWNEPNLKKEPFHGSANAWKAGRFFNVLWKACQTPITDAAGAQLAPKCSVIAGDFAEVDLTKKYMDEYKWGSGLKGKSHAWATHPYRTMHHQNRTMEFIPFLKATKGPVWLTESGAFYQRYSAVAPGSEFDESPNKTLGRDYTTGYEPNMTRQFNRMKWTLDTLLPWRYNGQKSRITHFYYYQWADNEEGWGTGLVRKSSTTSRPELFGASQSYCLYYYRKVAAATRNDRCS